MVPSVCPQAGLSGQHRVGARAELPGSGSDPAQSGCCCACPCPGASCPVSCWAVPQDGHKLPLPPLAGLSGRQCLVKCLNYGFLKVDSLSAACLLPSLSCWLIPLMAEPTQRRLVPTWAVPAHPALGGSQPGAEPLWVPLWVCQPSPWGQPGQGRAGQGGLWGWGTRQPLTHCFVTDMAQPGLCSCVFNGTHVWFIWFMCWSSLSC